MKTCDGCYICGRNLTERHPTYREMCVSCGKVNLSKRLTRADLSDFTALVTGGRVKIGFETALKLLRCGVEVCITTRFAEDAWRRFKCVGDYSEWGKRLRIYPADFRILHCVDQIAERVKDDVGRLDILVNNAAQTLRRPPKYYQSLLSSGTTIETIPALGPSQAFVVLGADLTERQLRETTIPLLSQVPLMPGDTDDVPGEFPTNQVDSEGQQEDRRRTNSWMLKIGEIHPIELMEVFLVNAVSPFLLFSRLKSIMVRTENERPSFVINVSAMEGNFADPEKNSRHPHTNMAKAALNMMTRSCAIDLAREGVLMTSVDPGWITNEHPFPPDQPRSARKFQLAIDANDGAARICDPIFRFVLDGERLSGILLKNYSNFPW